MGESVKCTVIHEGDEPDPGLIGAVSQGWPHILASLESLLETGESLVETRRGPEDVRVEEPPVDTGFPLGFRS